MAINITPQTVSILQSLVHDAFDVNATLDRIKTVIDTVLVYPKFSYYVHELAHNYALDMADGIGDLLEIYSEPVNYGNIGDHTETYDSIQNAVYKIYEIVLTFQNELNQGAKIAFDNMDIHIFKGLLDIIEKHNKYVQQVIIWKDIVDKYGDKPSLDVHIKDYDVLDR